MKLLHVDSSILYDASVTRKLSAAAVERILQTHQDAEVVVRDLAAAPLTHLSGAGFAGHDADVLQDQALKEDVAIGVQVLDEFLDADVIVVGAPMYNFTIPSQLKAWIDRILVAGRTFQYGNEGPEGLVGGKRVILCIGRGGVYLAGSPTAAFEHVETYLRTAFGFIGILDPEVIAADGVAMGAEARAKALDEGLAAASRLRVA